MRVATYALASMALVFATSIHAAGNVERGARVFQACAACHSLEPGRHMSGPSLAGFWERKAGTQPGFHRYSDALKHSQIVWNESTLDKWLSNPEATVPGNFMLFEGMREEQARTDLIAFLQAASEGKGPRARQMPAFPDLKKAPAEAVVSLIRHCRDTYYVTNGKSETRPFWEFNLRFKTDSSASGPSPGKPVLVGQGMQGDRAQVVFAAPKEISAFVREGC